MVVSEGRGRADGVAVIPVRNLVSADSSSRLGRSTVRVTAPSRELSLRSFTPGNARAGAQILQDLILEASNSTPMPAGPASPATSPTQASTVSDNAAALRELKALLDEGILTDDEVKAQKAQVLS